MIQVVTQYKNILVFTHVWLLVIYRIFVVKLLLSAHRLLAVKYIRLDWVGGGRFIINQGIIWQVIIKVMLYMI